MIKADLHVHTVYSKDSLTSCSQIINRCRKVNINCIAIADHGTIAGALKLKKVAPFTVIIAEEVETPYGEIMGMFLDKEIPNGVSMEEAVKQIKGQNGLICVPHPCVRTRSSALNYQHLTQIIDDIDIIEVFNSRNFSPTENDKAKLVAGKFNKLTSAGSDAHMPGEIGNAYIEMPDFSTKDEFIISLEQGKVYGHLANPVVHLISTGNKIIKHLNPRMKLA